MTLSVSSKFIRALIKPIILKMLADQPAHGYSLMVRIRNDFGFVVSASTLYPVLHILEVEGLVTTHWDTSIKAQKICTITPLGMEELERSLQEIAFLAHTLGVEVTE